MAQALNLLNMISFRYLRTRDVLQNTKVAAQREGVVGLTIDAVYYPTTPVAPPHSHCVI